MSLVLFVNSGGGQAAIELRTLYPCSRGEALRGNHVETLIVNSSHATAGALAEGSRELLEDAKEP